MTIFHISKLNKEHFVATKPAYHNTAIIGTHVYILLLRIITQISMAQLELVVVLAMIQLACNISLSIKAFKAL